MDFIERIFGISVDGGSGLLELSLLLVFLIVVSMPVIRQIKRSGKTLIGI
jgi:hypothetical protein